MTTASYYLQGWRCGRWGEGVYPAELTGEAFAEWMYGWVRGGLDLLDSRRQELERPL